MKGGARKGAGRKSISSKEKRVTLAVRILPKIYKKLKKMKSKSKKSFGSILENLIEKEQE